MGYKSSNVKGNLESVLANPLNIYMRELRTNIVFIFTLSSVMFSFYNCISHKGMSVLINEGKISNINL